MQTFLPSPDFAESAAILDYRRLGKQRVEAYQLLNVLTGGRQGWRNHPAAVMWQGYPDALGLYMNAMIREWMRRGYRNSMGIYIVNEPVALPPWLGDPAFHAAHRSNLLRKAPDFYAQYGWSEPPTLPYVWPVVTPISGGALATLDDPHTYSE